MSVRTGVSRVATVFALLLAFVLSGCYKAPVQETMIERNNVLGERDVASNFYEAQQILAIEEWKDNSDKIVNVYFFKPGSGDLLIPPVRCLGVPASSTESLEPNVGMPWYHNGKRSGILFDYFVVPVDGIDIRTTELAGKDGTYGDPVHYRQCMTNDGHYFDFSEYGGIPHIVSSQAFTFEPSTVKRDVETELRLKMAERIIADGGCVNLETLQETECEK